MPLTISACDDSMMLLSCAGLSGDFIDSQFRTKFLKVSHFSSSLYFLSVMTLPLDE